MLFLSVTNTSDVITHKVLIFSVFSWREEEGNSIESEGVLWTNEKLLVPA